MPSALDPILSMRCIDLQDQITVLKHEKHMLVTDLFRIAEALGVKEEWGGGLAPERIWWRIEELKSGEI